MTRLLAHPLRSFSRQQVVSLSQSSCESPVEITDGGGEGVAWNQIKTTAKKVCPLLIIQYSLLYRRSPRAKLLPSKAKGEGREVAIVDV